MTITIRHFDCAGIRNNAVAYPGRFVRSGKYLVRARDAAASVVQTTKGNTTMHTTAPYSSFAPPTRAEAAKAEKRAREYSVVRDAETAKRIAAMQAANDALWQPSK
jgi:hypothetical protein